jgi:intracellular sulfur oxidation DsrE/DsrF family protein
MRYQESAFPTTLLWQLPKEVPFSRPSWWKDSTESEARRFAFAQAVATTITDTTGETAMFARPHLNRLPSLLLFLFLLLAAVAVAPVSADDGYGKQKVVYHVNYYGPQQQAGALRNVQNHINAVGAENLELAVVMHGNGLSLLLYPDSLSETKMKEANADDQMQARIAGLKQQGVAFKVCANTLKGRNIEVDDLYDVDEADIVPSGVAELSKLQGQGYTYIKP